MSKKIEQLTENLVLKILPDEYELVDVEYVKENKDMYLRILIDKKQGMSLDDCEYLSTIIGAKLDEDDYIKDFYYLEISSQGIDRTLKKDKDFIREKGKEVEVKLFKKMDFGKECVGILEGLDENSNVIIDLDGEKITLERKNIAKINLYIEF